MTVSSHRCVVDTNVPATANRANPVASDACVAACAQKLQEIMHGGHLFVDDRGLIVKEYRAQLSAKGQPGPGDAFLKWVLTHEWGERHVTRVRITPKGSDHDFEELGVLSGDVVLDPLDRKFFAVAVTHPMKPPILQALDSKWWGWQEALEEIGINVIFLCEAEIAAIHARKVPS